MTSVQSEGSVAVILVAVTDEEVLVSVSVPTCPPTSSDSEDVLKVIVAVDGAAVIVTFN